MNNLFRHIEFLLLRHDCVIVPGLGAFIASMSSARIDMEKGVVLPPCRTIMFNQAVTLDDGLLANSYSRKHNLSFEESRMVILRDVNSVISIIQNNGVAECGNIGRLFMGEEGNLVFSPISSVSGFNKKLGFEPAELAINKTSVVENNTPSVEYDSETEGANDKGYYHLRISKTFTRMTAAFLIVAAVAIMVILKPIPRDEREQRASVVPVEALMPTQTKIVEKQDSVRIIESDAVETVKEDPKHYLIVATFSSAREAEAYASNYSTDEYSLTAVPSRRMCRVAVASSDDRDELRKKLNTRAISSKFPNAWIWSRE